MICRHVALEGQSGLVEQPLCILCFRWEIFHFPIRMGMRKPLYCFGRRANHLPVLVVAQQVEAARREVQAALSRRHEENVLPLLRQLNGAGIAGETAPDNNGIEFHQIEFLFYSMAEAIQSAIYIRGELCFL